MTSIKPFQLEDLLTINTINLDPLTENFNISFYSQYLIDWPNLFYKSTEHHGKSDEGDENEQEISGYMMAKTEGQLSKLEYHTHITAVTISDQYRRISLASKLCLALENISEVQQTLFIDLFVKVTNQLARKLYEKLDYAVYRRVIGYYSKSKKQIPSIRSKLDSSDENDDIDAFDMRKALPLDKDRRTVRENGGESFRVLPHEVRRYCQQLACSTIERSEILLRASMLHYRAKRDIVKSYVDIVNSYRAPLSRSAR
ncbi:naa20 [Candida oxycetoniae]|uniref:Naa20 n=1 Tax=Candida oxycetoniae TaxID=497107 RepID=A0AAI9SXF5_9ASCO|nr:naa20 [Candida oxycetoniae]KAI3404355.2 naa20 [Candida oxycetoniae]